MIQKETYLLNNIQRIKDKYNLDPKLIQRAIFALGLVERKYGSRHENR